MPYHWLDFTPPQPQIAAAPVEDFVTAASTPPSLKQKQAFSGHPLLHSWYAATRRGAKSFLSGMRTTRPAHNQWRA